MDPIAPPPAGTNAVDAAVPPVDNGTNPFFGRFGLRAGWGIAIFIVLFVVISTAFSIGIRIAEGKSPLPEKHSQTQTQPTKPAEDVKARSTLIGDGSGFAALTLVCFILKSIERRRIRVYGIGTNRIGDFLPGAFWGVATLSLLIGALCAAHALVFDARALTGPAAVFSGAKWLAAFLFVGLLEEYLTRGYLQYTLTRGVIGLARQISPVHTRAVAFWMVAVVMSCLFGAGHLVNPGESAPGIAAVFVAGMVFSYALWRTGSLWWAIGFHMAWDWAQSFLYGVPDSGYLSANRLYLTHPAGKALVSGGTAGPEGSIFVLPTLLLVVLIIRFTTAPGPQPELEPIPKALSVPPKPEAVIA